jgi:hypothetical protein
LGHKTAPFNKPAVALPTERDNVDDVTVHIVFGAIGGSKKPTRYYMTETLPSDEVWPPDELHNNVGRIKVEAYGDDITSAYVEVAGLDQETCEQMWDKLVKDLPLTKWWNEETE